MEEQCLLERVVEKARERGIYEIRISIGDEPNFESPKGPYSFIKYIGVVNGNNVILEQEIARPRNGMANLYWRAKSARRFIVSKNIAAGIYFRDKKAEPALVRNLFAEINIAEKESR